MAYDVSAAPLRRISPQFLAMIAQFYAAGKGGSCDNCCCYGERRQSSAELYIFQWEITGIPGLAEGKGGGGAWRRAGMMPPRCRHLAMSVRFLQDFRGHYGVIKYGPHECCNIVRALHDSFTMYCMCCSLTISERFHDHLAVLCASLFHNTSMYFWPWNVATYTEA